MRLICNILCTRQTGKKLLVHCGICHLMTEIVKPLHQQVAWRPWYGVYFYLIIMASHKHFSCNFWLLCTIWDGKTVNSICFLGRLMTKNSFSCHEKVVSVNTQTGVVLPLHLFYTGTWNWFQKGATCPVHMLSIDLECPRHLKVFSCFLILSTNNLFRT